MIVQVGNNTSTNASSAIPHCTSPTASRENRLTPRVALLVRARVAIVLLHELRCWAQWLAMPAAEPSPVILALDLERLFPACDELVVLGLVGDLSIGVREDQLVVAAARLADLRDMQRRLVGHVGAVGSQAALCEGDLAFS